MKSIIYALAFTIMVNANVLSQINEEWTFRYNGPVNLDDYAYVVKTDRSGNVVIGGYSQEGIPNRADYLVFKLSPNGQLIWNKKYNGTSNQDDFVRDIEVDSLNNIYVCGSSINIGTQNDIVVLKYSSSGDLIWSRNFNGNFNGNDYPSDMIMDHGGSIYITGYTESSQFNEDCVTVKYDSTGLLAWSRIYNGQGGQQDRGNKIIIGYDHNIVITGTCFQQSTGFDFLTIKYDGTGNIVWTKTFNNEPDVSIDNGISLSKDVNNNIFVTGSCANSVSFKSNVVTLKYNPSGQLIWARRFDGLGNDDDFPVDIAVDNLNNVIVGGITTGINTSLDYLILKYSNNGDSIWNRKYSGPGSNDDILSCITIDRNNNIYVSGDVFSSNSDILTIKYSSDGNIIWTKPYNGTGNGSDICSSMFIDSSYNIFIAGTSLGTGTNLDAIAIKYSQPIGISQISTNVPNGNVLYQNYPNPFNPFTNIKFDISEESEIQLGIFDINGKEILRTSVKVQAGSYEYRFNGSHLASGIYFYKLKSNSFIWVKKMIIVK